RAAVNYSRFAHGRVNADFPEFYRNDSTRPERTSDHDGEVSYFSLTPTAHFDVSIPPSVMQGVSFTGTVTVRDGLNNVFAGYNGPICQGGTLQLNATDIPGATYSWTGPHGFTAATRNPSISNAQPAASGLYSVAINNAGCLYNASTTATVDALPPTPTISADT